MIEDYEVTTASAHDRKIDFSNPKEPIMRDKACCISAKGIAFNMISLRGHLYQIKIKR